MKELYVAIFKSLQAFIIEILKTYVLRDMNSQE